jgi:cytochrome c biogenesis protein ResB
VKYALTLIVLIGFATIAGAVLVNADMGHSICNWVYGSSADCPLNAFDFANFHLNALLSFSTAVFSIQLFMTLIAAALLTVVFGKSDIELQPVLVSVRQRLSDNSMESERRANFWLSLFEKRDPA